jgi:hypothetical protein
MSTGHKAARGQPGGRDAQNWKIWRKVHGVSIGLDSRKYSAFSMGLSRLWRLRSVNWADMTGPLPSRRSITYNLLYVKSLAVEEDSQ